MNNSSVTTAGAKDGQLADQIYGNTVLVTIIQQSISIVGIAHNLSLVYVTVKHKVLRRTYGILLAICSFCDALTESATFLATALVIWRTKISLITCFWAQLHSIIGATNSNLCLFYISIDRLIAVALPFSYQSLAKSSGKYIALLHTLSLAICCFTHSMAYKFAAEHSEISVFCEPSDAFQGPSLMAALVLAVFFMITTMLVYLIIWFLLKAREKKKNATDSPQQLDTGTQKCFKSLAAIMAVIFFCWFCSCLCNMIVPAIISDQAQQILAIRIVLQLNTIGGAINLPVLYFCSLEYQKVLKAEFKFIRFLSKHLSTQNAVIGGGGVTSVQLLQINQKYANRNHVHPAPFRKPN